jgi:hypothetical protein
MPHLAGFLWASSDDTGGNPPHFRELKTEARKTDKSCPVEKRQSRPHALGLCSDSSDFLHRPTMCLWATFPFAQTQTSLTQFFTWLFWCLQSLSQRKKKFKAPIYA